ncbi:MAG: protein kinase [Candidatus Latescibacterota bacterium]|nr:MAG: protein kinase [Candidatus Latescibacterota bacterium]
MGIVYKALDTKLNRYVALKVLPAHLTADPERRLRFQREAQATAALQHPNIAVIFEVGEHEGTPFLAMEYVEGQTLRERLEQGSFPMRDWLRVAIAIAEGVARAHAGGVVHRDLKPDNVLLTSDRQVKILDFGLAKLLDLEALPEESDRGVHTRMNTVSGELTRAGQVFGTAAYMSPEQARGDSVDHRSDIFSLGVMLYECASGKRPFRGDSRVETLHGIIHQDPPALSALNLDIPADAERVVRKTLEKDPERRYQRADELAIDLRNLQRDLDSGQATAPTTVVSGAVPRQRSRARIVGPLVVLAALIAVGAWWLRRDDATGTVATTPVAQEASIAVVGFENLNDPKDSDHLGRMLMGLITTDLAESGGLSVVSMPKVLSARRQVAGSAAAAFDAATAAETAQQAGATLMLVGQVGQVGERMLMTTELVDVQSGQTLGSHQQTATSIDDLFMVAGAIADDVRQLLGKEAPRPEQAFDLADALTASPAAYRKFAAGEIALHQMQFVDAIQQFGQAIREDSTFAMAYYKRAIAENWAGREEDAATGLRRGLAHIDRLAPRWKTVFETYLLYSEGEIDAAHDKLVAFLDESPDMPDPYYTLGEILTHESRYRDIRRSRALFERALELDPTFKVVFFHLFDAYLVADDLDSAQRLLARYKEENPADSAVRETQATLLVAEGRLKEAIAIGEDELLRGRDHIALRLNYMYLLDGQLERAYESANADLQRHLAMNVEGGGEQGLRRATRGGMQIARGQIRKGLEDLRLGAAHMATGRLEALAAGAHVNRAEIRWLAGETDAALEALRDAAAADPLFFRLYLWRARILCEAGRDAEAKDALNDLVQAANQVRNPAASGWVDLVRAELDLAAGRIEPARQKLLQVAELPPEYLPFDARPELQARVEEAAGETLDAIAAYRNILERARRRVFVRPATTIRIRYQLARLEDQVGDVEAARGNYEKFLLHWGQADLPLPIVAEARARLIALQQAP